MLVYSLAQPFNANQRPDQLDILLNNIIVPGCCHFSPINKLM